MRAAFWAPQNPVSALKATFYIDGNHPRNNKLTSGDYTFSNYSYFILVIQSLKVNLMK